MLSINEYDVYIFDCDGVILDSNKLKIDAMKKSLECLGYNSSEVKNCVEYFKLNFGKSRFHHIEYFVENFLHVNNFDLARTNILSKFSSMCEELYLQASITPGFIGFIERLSGEKYVASGSEQNELRHVLYEKKLEVYFNEIYGSPTKKSDLVKKVILSNPGKKIVMVGDAMSDLESAKVNGIDFIAYTRFSNVVETITQEAIRLNYRVIDDWECA